MGIYRILHKNIVHLKLTENHIIMHKASLIFSAVAIIFLCSFAGAQWASFESKKGNFKASLPVKPEENEQEVESEIGKIKMNIFTAETDKIKGENSMYMMMYVDYADSLFASGLDNAAADNVLRSAVSGAAKNIQGVVIKEENKSYKKNPGKHVLITFADGQGIMDGWMFLVKNRMYVLETGYEKGKGNMASVDKFFASFQTLDGK